MKSTGIGVSSPSGSRPVPKRSMREAEAERLAALAIRDRPADAAWRPPRPPGRHAAGLDAERLELAAEPGAEVGSMTLSRDRRTNMQCRLAAGAERQRRADDPAVDVLHQVVALGGGHELRGQHFLPCCRACAPARRTCCGSSPSRLAIGCWTSRKRFSISADLMCAHPDAVRMSCTAACGFSVCSSEWTWLPPSSWPRRAAPIGVGRGVVAVGDAARRSGRGRRCGGRQRLVHRR